MRSFVLSAALVAATIGCDTPIDSCFIAGTPVLTPRGERAIETLEIGDEVYSWDHTLARPVVRKVMNTLRGTGTQLFRIQAGAALIEGVTEAHPIYDDAAGRYRDARAIDGDSRLIVWCGGRDPHARSPRCDRLETEGTVDVFNLTVEGPEHNYFAGGILVHNKSIAAPDRDGDGFFSHEDCDDEDSAIHPEADEICDDGVDNDCDGQIDDEDVSCIGIVGASSFTAFGGLLDDAASAVAVDAAGNLVVAGRFTDEVVFGGQTFTSVGGTDLLVAKLSSSGDVLWAQRHGDASDDTVTGIAVGADGRIVLTANGTAGGFVIALDGDGTTAWTRAYDLDFGWVGFEDVALDDAGAVWVVGTYSGDVDLGLGPLPTANEEHALLLGLDSDGEPVSSEGLGRGALTSVALLSTGDLAVGGTVDGGGIFGGTQLQGYGPAALSARIDRAGEVIWIHAYEADLTPAVYGSELVDLAASTNGPLAMAIALPDAVDGSGESFGEGDDVRIVELDEDGSVLSNVAYGDQAHQRVGAIAYDADGRLLVTGTFAGQLAFGTNILQSESPTGFIARIDSASADRWASALPPSAVVYDIASRTSGSIAIAGAFDFRITVNGAEHVAVGQSDGFVLQLTP